MISNRARFINDIVKGQLQINNRPKAAIETDLGKLKYDQVDGGYGYLLGMAIHSLTKERFEELLRQKGDAEAELERVKATAPKDMYLQDLKELKKAVPA